MTRNDDEVIEKVRKTGPSYAITIPKKEAFAFLRCVPYVRITHKVEDGRQFMIVERCDRER